MSLPAQLHACSRSFFVRIHTERETSSQRIIQFSKVSMLYIIDTFFENGVVHFWDSFGLITMIENRDRVLRSSLEQP